MLPEDLFVVDMDEKELSAPPAAKKFAASQCTPLFFNAFRLRDAGACIHTHSQHAVMATLLTRGNEFRITHQEMIKGIRIGSTKENLKFFDELVVPIIDNTVRAITHTSRSCTLTRQPASASASAPPAVGLGLHCAPLCHPPARPARTGRRGESACLHCCCSCYLCLGALISLLSRLRSATSLIACARPW
jgi:hypothetical protein